MAGPNAIVTMPTYHPSHLLKTMRGSSGKEAQEEFILDLTLLFQYVGWLEKPKKTKKKKST
jgi:uracil-DNA glycosylase